MHLTWLGAGRMGWHATLAALDTSPFPTRHPTSTNMPEEKIAEALEGAKKANIRNIVALRGGGCRRGPPPALAVSPSLTCALVPVARRAGRAGGLEAC